MVHASAFEPPTDLERAILEAACRPAMRSRHPPDFARRPPLVKHIRAEVQRRRGLDDLPLQTLKGQLTRLCKKYGVSEAPMKTKLSQLVKVAYELGLIDGWGPDRAASGSVLVRRWCVGRRSELDGLVAAIETGSRDPVPITGAAGIGKSTLASALSHDPRIVAWFERRYNVACAGIAGAAGLTNAIAAVLGDDVGPRLAEILAALRGAFLILDGLEVPWHADRGDIEGLLCALAGVDGLALVCCIRGDAVPATVPWGPETRLGQLDGAAARELFGDRAGSDRSREPRASATSSTRCKATPSGSSSSAAWLATSRASSASTRARGARARRSCPASCRCSARRSVRRTSPTTHAGCSR